MEVLIELPRDLEVEQECSRLLPLLPGVHFRWLEYGVAGIAGFGVLTGLWREQTGLRLFRHCRLVWSNASPADGQEYSDLSLLYCSASRMRMSSGGG